MAGTLWFGNDNHMELVKCALRGWNVPNEGYSEILRYVNGGAGVVRSFASARTYDLSWSGTPEELNPIKAFQQGYWGPGPFRIADPLTFRTNMAPPNWASPGLIETGDWKNIYDSEPTFSDTPANTYGNPLRTATWSILGDANDVPSKILTIPIPPTHTLSVAVRGSRTGTGVVAFRPILPGSGVSYGSVATSYPLSVTTPWSTTPSSWSGANAKALQVYFTKTTSATSTISISSIFAQMTPTGSSPSSPPLFLPGDGVMGLEFASGMTETYYHDSMGNIPARKGSSVALVEVEPWL